jgi:hypothetical protein
LPVKKNGVEGGDKSPPTPKEGHMSFSAPEGRLRKPPDLGRQELARDNPLVLGIPRISSRASKFRRHRLDFVTT